MIKDFLKNNYGLSDITADIAIKRGISDEASAQRFFDANIDGLSDPYSLLNMDKGVERIKKAILNKEKILIFGDYDCDGIGAVAILINIFKEFSADVSYYIPNRKSDGYGIKWESLSRAYAQFCPSLIVSVDCGISSHSEVARAKAEWGVDFIITDHHSIPTNLPDAIVINPHLNNGPELCGAGVAFMLATAISSLESAMKYVDLCALSTVADLVPLKGDNRIIVKLGLKKLNSRKTNVGLKELIEISGIKVGQEITSYDIAFKLAPRLNSAGRLDTAEKALLLLLTDDPFLAKVVAAELDANNKERQILCESIYNEAVEKLKSYDLSANKHILLCDEKWDSGVLGIAASRIVEQFELPTILLTVKDGYYVGSGRSIKGINMFQMLQNVGDVLYAFGGHSMAAGMQLKVENFDLFMQSLTSYLESFEISHAETVFEAELQNSDVSVKLAKEIKLFEPFGLGNPKPLFKLCGRQKYVRIKDYNHLSAKLGREGECIAFSQGKNIDILNSYVDSSIVKLEYEVFRNVERAKCYFVAEAELSTTLTKEFLSHQFLSLSLGRKYCKSKNLKRKITEKCGNLVITFSPENYFRLLRENHSYRGYVAIRGNLFIDNAVVLAPSAAFCFEYYSRILFYDAVPQALYDALDCDTAVNVEAVGAGYSRFLVDKIDDSVVCKCFAFVVDFFNGKKFTSFNELFTQAMYNRVDADVDYIKTQSVFMAAIEIKAIGFDASGKIIVCDMQPDFGKSQLLRLSGYVG